MIEDHAGGFLRVDAQERLQLGKKREKRIVISHITGPLIDTYQSHQRNCFRKYALTVRQSHIDLYSNSSLNDLSDLSTSFKAIAEHPDLC